MDFSRDIFIENGLDLLKKTGCEKLFLFLGTEESCTWFLNAGFDKENIVPVVPQSFSSHNESFRQHDVKFLTSWSGNQSRFSRIKYAFLYGVLEKIISEHSKVICVLGPWGSSHLDTMTVHDLSLSWSEEFPFDPRRLINDRFFHVVMAMVDIALDIGTSGREGKTVGTAFVVGDTERVLRLSHQAVFNPFKGYPREERSITRPEVVESIKELALLDGATLVSEEGYAVAAGRHLDTSSPPSALSRGLGARHRAASGITSQTNAVAIVVSASTGKVTIFDSGKTIAILEPITGRRLV